MTVARKQLDGVGRHDWRRVWCSRPHGDNEETLVTPGRNYAVSAEDAAPTMPEASSRFSVTLTP